MSIQLRPDLQKFVDKQVRDGRYDSAEEAINAAVARLQTEHEFSVEERQDLLVDLDAGLAEAEQGQFAEFTAEAIIAEQHARRAGGESHS